MVYKLLGWGLVGGVYHIRYGLFHVLVKKLHFISELVHRIRIILRFYEVGWSTEVYFTLVHFYP